MLDVKKAVKMNNELKEYLGANPLFVVEDHPRLGWKVSEIYVDICLGDLVAEDLWLEEAYIDAPKEEWTDEYVMHLFTTVEKAQEYFEWFRLVKSIDN